MDCNIIILISVLIFLILLFIVLNIYYKSKTTENYNNISNQYANINISNSSKIVDPQVTSIEQNLDTINDAAKFGYIPNGLRISPEDVAKLSANKKNQYLDDLLFANVITYENDDVDNENFKFENSGIYKCLTNKNCNSCVEYGVTGTTMCFPKNHYNANSEYYDPKKRMDNYDALQEVTNYVF